MYMTIRQRRIEKGWSQLQLAELSGLSLRTIQRVEKGQTPTTETLKSLAAVFQVDFNELVDESYFTEIDESKLTEEEMQELEHIRDVQRFLRDMIIFAVFLPVVVILNTSDKFNAEWILFMFFFWGAYLIWEAFEVFDARDFLGRGWEKRMLEKRLGRKID